MQQLAVGVQLRRPLEDLQVARQVADHEEEQDGPGHRHHRLLAVRRSPEARRALVLHPYRARAHAPSLVLPVNFLMLAHLMEDHLIRSYEFPRRHSPLQGADARLSDRQ